MGFWTKYAFAGAGAAATSIMIYEVISRFASPQAGAAMAIVAGAGAIVAAASVWVEEYQRKSRLWLARHDREVKKKYFAELSERYKMIDRYAEREIPYICRREYEEADEEDKPIRKVCGRLAMDFSKAPEEVKREIFG